ncbi:hypothetical protein WOLCODRAFT_138261 [Wolfiporia cocos MD-104 SS10]|uniref:C2H2-type domain-containing protein n=1 Tax=Wolfiporia cocos (strain MD-104) TaxID=742152 RepID=A0A2H3JWF9_WOLCO|nr:hypothetical protein WOLCODRAFT_138261 [Wolfiporia cocos MD-104 SS10]
MAYCSRCDRYFATKYALSMHRRDSNAHHICYTCNKDFDTRWGLVQHYVQSPQHFYCERCDNHYDDEDELHEHKEDYHYYCKICNEIFDSAVGLREHNRQKHRTIYICKECNRGFSTESNLRSHLHSALHLGRTLHCPGHNCTKSFPSPAALILHFESGTCPSHITRRDVDRCVVQLDRSNVITNPARLLRGPEGTGYTLPDSPVTYATERAWNGYAYECVLCHREFSILRALDQHLQSAAHADKIYRCPRAFSGCGTEFRTLSALVQHVESEQCGVRKFSRAVQDALGGLTSSMNMLTF